MAASSLSDSFLPEEVAERTLLKLPDGARDSLHPLALVARASTVVAGWKDPKLFAGASVEVKTLSGGSG